MKIAPIFSAKWIWKADTLPRIKTFLWMGAHNNIGVNVCLEKRGVVLEIICPICQGRLKTVLHAFQDCPQIKQVWNQLDIMSSNQAFWRNNLQDWLSSNGRENCSLVAANPPWKIVFLFAVWNIWKSRNKFVFSRKNRNPNLAVEIVNQATEFIHCVSSPSLQTCKVIKRICWERPPQS